MSWAPIELSSLAFERQFARFREQVALKAGGQPFKSFQDAFVVTEEGYKADVRGEALRLLNVASWKPSSIGKGRILNRVIQAIEIQQAGGGLRNNLVAWPNKWGRTNQPHRALLKAVDDRAARIRFDRWFYEFFCGPTEDDAAFSEFCGLAGRYYDVVAYLFFLKDWTRFMPIATKTFDKAFASLGIHLTTTRHCSWENYAQYNEALGEVMTAIRDVANVPDVRLIDAHSFCWMLIRLEGEAPPAVRISVPTRFNGSAGVATSPDVTIQTSFDELGDDFFDNLDANRRRVGRLAQDIALAAERLRLARAGHPSPNDAVRPVWNEPARGYDILSHELDGTERYVEVKSARRARSAVTFFVSRSEWHRSQLLPNYHYYLVFNATGARPAVEMIEGARVVAKSLRPETYLATMVP